MHKAKSCLDSVPLDVLPNKNNYYVAEYYLTLSDFHLWQDDYCKATEFAKEAKQQFALQMRNPAFLTSDLCCSKDLKIRKREIQNFIKCLKYFLLSYSTSSSIISTDPAWILDLIAYYIFHGTALCYTSSLSLCFPDVIRWPLTFANLHMFHQLLTVALVPGSSPKGPGDEATIDYYCGE